MVTTVETARLLALRAAATPGPWRTSGNVITVEEADWDIGIANCKALGKSYDDAKLIAEAVNALPGLLAEVERLRAALEAVKTRGHRELEQPPWTSHGQEARVVRDVIKIAREALNAKG